MNIHEYQAKEILKKYKIEVPKGVIILDSKNIEKKVKNLKFSNLVIKAQIHSGGRGKAGGIKLVKTLEELQKESDKMLGKVLVTHQTGPRGKKVKRLYIEEASDISKEFYLSCLIDRENSKIAFISSIDGGMDIEKIAIKAPEKIVTTKVELKNNLDEEDIEKIIKPFNFNKNQKKDAQKLIQVLFRILQEKDASLIEINPLIIKIGRASCRERV